MIDKPDQFQFDEYVVVAPPIIFKIAEELREHLTNIADYVPGHKLLYIDGKTDIEYGIGLVLEGNPEAKPVISLSFEIYFCAEPKGDSDDN